MKTLMIKDLSESKELDSAAMASVAGGSYLDYVPYWGDYKVDQNIHSTVVDFTAEQFIGQEQNVDTATGVNVAFAEHLKSDVTATQNGDNVINFGL